jgi:hypothetical protein
MRKLIAVLFFAVLLVPAYGQNPPRKTRGESFFGLHFDFHADYKDGEIGKTLTPAMIESMLEMVKPDFIQVDCKGHPGFSSYPTKVGNQTKGYVQDTLKLFRQVTARHGIALYVHYSGVWDGRVVQKHPAWARLDSRGKLHKMELSRHSPYLDQLMIPQLKELAGEYDVDGAWVDGDCWAASLDYSPRAVADFVRQTGISKAPLKPEDPGWAAWMQFSRQAYKNYMKKYVDAIHAFKPGFQITSNWAFTGFMPEPVDAKIDYISGDLASQNSVASAAFEARCIAPQGKPWDLMAWSFGGKDEFKFLSAKSPLQLMQEAAEVLAVGGGYQVYFTQNRDASLKERVFSVAAQVAEFCRQRQPFSHRGVAVPQVGLLYSSYAFYKNEKKLYTYSDGIADETRGTLISLLDRQFSVQIVSEHHLKGRLNDFPVIVIPGWKDLSQDLLADLRSYVQNGGNLLLIGPGPVSLFLKETGVSVTKNHEKTIVPLGFQGRMCSLKTDYIEALPPAGAWTVAGFYQESDFRSSSVPAASVVSYGKGKIAMIYANLGATYLYERSSLAAEFLAAVMGQLQPDPVVKVEGSNYIHLNLTQKDGKTLLHLINSSGPHDNEKVFEWTELLPLNPIKMHWRMVRKPKTIWLQPEGKTLDFTYENGEASFLVPRLDLYSIVQVE